MNKDRDIYVDIIKGIAIILMVMGHTAVSFTRFIYLFHMAVFFIASGYCLKESSCTDFKSFFHYTKKRIIGLYVPYVIINTLFSLLNNFFIDIHFYSDNISIYQYINDFDMGQTPIFSRWSDKEILINILKTLLFSGATEIGGVMWFLAVLFETSILFVFIEVCLSAIARKVFALDKKNERTFKTIVQAIFSIFFLCIGYECSVYGIFIHFFQTDFSVYSLFFMGYFLKNYDVSNREKSLFERGGIIVLSFLGLIILENFVNIQIQINSYGNPICLLVCSFLGWEFLYELSALLSMTFLRKPIIILGQNTIFILAFHIAVFKIINLIFVKINNLPVILTAVFPTLYKGGYYSIIYSFFGITVPLIISLLYKTIFESRLNQIFKKRNKVS